MSGWRLAFFADRSLLKDRVARISGQRLEPKADRRIAIVLAASVAVVAAMVAPIGMKVIAGNSNDSPVLQMLEQARIKKAKQQRLVVQDRIPVETVYQPRSGTLQAYAPRERGLIETLFGGTGAPQPFIEDGQSLRLEQPTVKRAKKTAAPAPVSMAITGRSYCVRLCDGYFFPIGNVGDKTSLRDHETMCAATCPSSPTRLYVAPAGTEGIDKAVSADGKPYAKLATAFLHRETLLGPKCGCRVAGTDARDLVSIFKDFTLRRGDAIVTRDGVKIFDGGQKWPYQATAFRDLARTKSVAGNERRLLKAITVALGDEDIAPVDATPVPDATPAKKKKSKKQKSAKLKAKAATELAEADTNTIRVVGPSALVVR